MKRFMSLCALSFALCAGMVSCEKTPDNSYEGTNYIYLSSDNTSMYGVQGESITVNVMLTTSLDEDAEINFEVKGGEGIVELEGNPVLIPAGETTASFDIKCVEGIDIAENTVLSVDLVSGPEKLAVRDPFQFTVMVEGSSSLTDEQKAIIEDYKSSTGIDLSKYIGLVDVTTLYTGTDPDTYEPLPVQTITGKTAIVLSEASVSGKPVLKMLSNPMGIQDEMYETLRTVTVDNTDFWYGEWASPSYAMLMEAEKAVREALAAKFGDKADYGESSLQDAVMQQVNSPVHNWEYILENSVLGDDYSSVEELRESLEAGDLLALQKTAAVIRQYNWGLVDSLDTFKKWKTF